VSLPETDKALIRWNTFDLRGTPHWGSRSGTRTTRPSPRTRSSATARPGVDYGLSMNTNPLRAIVTNNTASNMRTLVGIAGDYHQITGNA
jgi:hypothetical protein